jgi:hypothetical protein
MNPSFPKRFQVSDVNEKKVSGVSCQVSAQPLAAEVYPPLEGGRFDR